jgi:hypothetical protein
VFWWLEEIAGVLSGFLKHRLYLCCMRSPDELALR